MTDEQRLKAIRHFADAIESLASPGRGGDSLAHRRAVGCMQGAMDALGLEDLNCEENGVRASKRGLEVLGVLPF